MWVLHLAVLFPLHACGDSGASEDDQGTPSTASEATSSSPFETETAGVPDELPPVPTLSSPAADAVDVGLETELCWELVEDPEGEPLRYRVFIDDAVLGEGVLGEGDGYEGPCVGPLLFAHERSYSWQVEAYELDDPARGSGRSEANTFSTIGDGLSALVFLDDFESDQGWEIDGDALTGHWVRGTPAPALDADALSQPSLCPNSSGCMFTGPNPDGLADAADVSGGATRLLSAPFDLSGANAASVRLDRFFYKSALMPEAHLRVELLVPHLPEDGDYDAYELELLELGTSEAPANLWTPREYLACGIPMRAGSRLRVEASDLGAGILEAAIDNVSVHTLDDASPCAPGLGARCEPEAPDSCDPDELCCSQGVLNRGVYRCEDPVAGLIFEEPTESAEAPGNGDPGCNAPDLIVDVGALEPLFTDIFMSDDTCELLEGCVGGAGWRSVMLFTVATPNVGSMDLALGVPANLPELYHYSPCHDHYHFDEFARYELRSGDEVVATGHKQAFCLLDTISWAWPLEQTKFDCSNQGVSRGFSDFYESGLPCQWVDVTGVAAGDYTLRITLNEPRPEHALAMLNERDYTNNLLEVAVTIP